MDFSQRYNMEQVPEWRSCYLNLQFMLKVSDILRNSTREKLALHYITQDLEKQKAEQRVLKFKNKTIPEEKLAEFKRYYKFFYETSIWANDMFLEALRRNLELYKKFTKWKYCEIESNYLVACRFNVLGGPSDPSIKSKNFKRYLENLSVESSYLARMVQSNIQAQNRILNQHLLHTSDMFVTPQPQCKSSLSIVECDILKRKITRLYIKINKYPRQKCRARLQKLAQPLMLQKSYHLFIGLLVGTIITIIVFMIIILTDANVTIQTDPIFNQDFPLWRGIGLILFFLWILGIDFYIFQKFKISHKIILENEQQTMPKSNDFFKVAGVLSTFYVIVFIIYSLEIADIIETGNFPPQWLPLFVWIAFIVFLFNPFPVLFYNGRKLFFMGLYKIFISLFSPPVFLAIFTIANGITLLNIFRDVVYTVCYYTTLQLPFPTEQVIQGAQCRTPASIARFAYALVVYGIRINQCLRMAITNKVRVQFVNALKFSLVCLTVILAYVYQQANQKNFFPAWLTFAIISTCFSFVWDIRIASDLFHLKSKNKFLRDQLLFAKPYYYIWIVINFFLRMAWTLNISPNIIRNLIGSTQLITMIFGFLQIFRRGIWNLMRLQAIQIQNNKALNAMPKDWSRVDKKIKDYVQNNKSKQVIESAQTLFQTQKHILNLPEPIDRNFKKQKQEIIKQIKQLEQFFQNENQKVQQKISLTYSNMKAFLATQKEFLDQIQDQYKKKKI